MGNILNSYFCELTFVLLGLYIYGIEHVSIQMKVPEINPLTAGPHYIRFLKCIYEHNMYHINNKYLKIFSLHFVESE